MSEFDGVYDAFFRRALNAPPHPYQRRVAMGEALPQVVEIPPGYGKTAAIVLAWLWRRLFHPDPSVRTATPRRLVYALPQRALTDQVSREIAGWLKRLEIAEDTVALHVVMGGRARAARPWRSAPEQCSILVGTIDMITSRALLRGYGTPRNAYPMDAALMWNDSHLVIDEVQAAPASTTTLRQIDAFRRGATVGPAGLTCMSATIPRPVIDTVDNPYPPAESIIQLGPDDDQGELRIRRAAVRSVRKLDAGHGDTKALAALAERRHRPGTLTLVIANTVRGARDIHAATLRLKPEAQVCLLHSQFRPVDRAPIVDTLIASPPPEGVIVISTQVVEAGIDVDASVLITEACPWPSVVQRSGRCNRKGQTPDAELWWLEPIKSAPYHELDITASSQALEGIEGREITNEALLELGVPSEAAAVLTIRRSDFASLFDTSPDLSGHDLDIAPYVRDTEDLSVQVCWLEWDGTVPPNSLRPPNAELRCRVPLGGVAELLRRGVSVWRFDVLKRGWATISRRSPPRPGEVLILASSSGGYRTDIGFDPTSVAPVPVTQTELGDADAVDDPNEDAINADARSFGAIHWVGLEKHLDETAEAAADLTGSLGLPPDHSADIVLAARVHDIGKAHPTWQDALCATALDAERSDVDAGRPWAKSAHHSTRLKYPAHIQTFRHELAGLLLLDGPLAGLLDTACDPDLVRYLVLAHHGKLRVQIRDAVPTSAPAVFGLIRDETVAIPIVLDHPTTELTTTLARLELGGDPAAGVAAWADVVSGLLDRYRPYRLAYYETLVRVADWRASALHDLDGPR